MASRKL
jgi:hypothetical protein